MAAHDIRRVGKEELQAVQQLAQVIWPRAYRNIIGPDRVDAMLAELYRLDTLEAEIDAGHVFWIVRVNRIDVGYASAHMDAERLWLRKLYVRHDFRGLGLGHALIDEALREFPEAVELALNVNKDNSPAIGWYLRNGFEVEAEVPIIMGPYAFNDLVLCKRLQDAEVV